MNFMPYQDDTKLLNNLLYMPYCFQFFDKQDIEARINQLVPENMYAIFSS